MSWDNLKTHASSGGGNSGRYFKLRDGDRHEVITLGEPVTKEVTWSDGRTSRRYCVAVYCTSSPAECQSFEFGPGIAKDLAVENPKPGQTVVRLKRTGSGKEDTKYTVAEVRPATAEELAEAKRCFADKTWDLEEEGWWPLAAHTAAGSGLPPSPPPASSAPAADDDIPF